MAIYIIGFMGSGKSTWGKRIAGRLGLKFIDLDEYLEQHYDMSIPQIFNKYGEVRFRSMEQECLHMLLDQTDVLISTGGGTPCYFDNMDRMNASGTTVYLQMPAGALVDRLKNAKEERPLISGMNEEELASYIDRKLQERVPFYKRADIIIEPLTTDWKTAVQQIDQVR